MRLIAFGIVLTLATLGWCVLERELRGECRPEGPKLLGTYRPIPRWVFTWTSRHQSILYSRLLGNYCYKGGPCDVNYIDPDNTVCLFDDKPLMNVWTNALDTQSLLYSLIVFVGQTQALSAGHHVFYLSQFITITYSLAMKGAFSSYF